MTAPTDCAVADATLRLDAFRASITPLLRHAVNTNTAMPGFLLREEHVLGTLSLTFTAEIILASDAVRITCCGTGDPETYRQLAKAMGTGAADQRDSKFMFVFSNPLDATLLRSYEQVLAGRTPRFVVGQTAVPAMPDENHGFSLVSQVPRGDTLTVIPPEIPTVGQFPRPISPTDMPSGKVPPVEPKLPGMTRELVDA